MEKKIKVGICGFGVVGARRLEYLEKSGKFQIVALCDNKFKDFHNHIPLIKCFQSSEELLRQDLDAVFVCLPNDVAPQVTIAALNKGFHVFCEKPPGRSVEDILLVRQAESQHPKLKLKYGFNHRYHHSVIKALALIKSGEMGSVLNMRGVYGKSAIIPWPRVSAENLGLSGRRYWRTDREISGGGILLDQGIHMVDLMRTFAGEFVEYKSMVTNSYWKHDVEDNAYALMRTASGAVAMLHSTATQWRHKFSLDVHLSEGALTLSGILSSSRSYGEEELRIILRKDSDNGNPEERVISYLNDDSWGLEIAEFAECILNDEAVKIGSSLDALKTMQTVFNIYNADPGWSAYEPS